MVYKKYCHARNVAWQLLIDFKICSLPVKITTIVKALDIHCFSYKTGIGIIETLGLRYRVNDSDGFTFSSNNGYYIFYNQNCTQQRCRFTIAHELGHILLGHLPNSGYTLVNKEPAIDDNEQEQQANVFASRLLAPACVLWGCKVDTAQQIATLCGISLNSSEFRLIRLQALYKRNKFLKSDLEKQVFKNFNMYIKNHHHSV